MTKQIKRQRGFLLVVVVGLLAVLLTVCIGFLSYTRGEVGSVATLRDKNDTTDIFYSAIDWTIANVNSDLMTGAGTFDPTKSVSLAKDGNNWWYRPYEMGLGVATTKWGHNWPATTLPYIDANKTEAPWTYLPENFFPSGGVRGRFSVQVIDLNAFMNLNDWNEDCNPTQCQMAHMFMDAYGERGLEKYRAYRDGGTGGWSGFATQCPLRYQEAWRVVTHTTRYPDWLNRYRWESLDNVASYNWVTANSCWMGLCAPEWYTLRSIIQSDGIPQYDRYQQIPTYNYNGSQGYFPIDAPPGDKQAWSNNPPPNFVDPGFPRAPWDMGGLGYYISGFSLQSYVDPDTGRSPVNVNTCYNSGEFLPMNNNLQAGNATFTMEAVFNVESLRRIIKVGEFWSPTTNSYRNVQTDWDKLDQNEWAAVEDLTTKLAFQYQETLCRYFTGTYAHSRSRKYPQLGANIGTYAAVYPSASPLPAHACGTTDYSATRFKTDLKTFRNWVRDDLLLMASTPVKNPTYSGGQPMPATTDDTVSFDKSGNPQIAQGKLDMRTACAVCDNIIPGKPTGGEPGDLTRFPGFTAYGAGDPLWELYKEGVGRQEDIDDSCNVYGYEQDNPLLRALVKYSAGTYPGGTAQNSKDHNGFDQTLLPKGYDVCENTAGPKGPWCQMVLPPAAAWPPTPAPTYPVNKPSPPQPHVIAHVPSRQRVFGPDSFSTELTTTTTTFMLIVNAQLVDAQSVVNNPNNPDLHRDLFWNQWGVVLEVAPDVLEEKDAATNPDFHYYQKGLPRLRKSDPKWVDDLCTTLTAYNLANGGGLRVTTNSTAVQDWQTDLRWVTPGQESAFYSGGNQLKKRVVIRSIWSLNQNIDR
jgi:hypothetical protein